MKSPITTSNHIITFQMRKFIRWSSVDEKKCCFQILYIFIGLYPMLFLILSPLRGSFHFLLGSCRRIPVFFFFSRNFRDISCQNKQIIRQSIEIFDEFWSYFFSFIEINHSALCSSANRSTNVNRCSSFSTAW